MAWRGNSGSSSRKRTPRWARLTSPGLARTPPPASAAWEAPWWGSREGGAHDEAAAVEHAGDGVDHADFDGFGGGEVGEERREAGGEHALAGAGGPTSMRL